MMSTFFGTMTSLRCSLLLLLLATTSCNASPKTIEDAKKAAMARFSVLFAALQRCDIDTITNCTKFKDTPSCSCDWRTCRLYADCCKTLPALDANQTIPEGQQSMKKVVSCINLHRLHSSEFNESWSRDVYVVNRCPSSVGDEQVAALCMMGSHEDSEAFLRLPVYGRQSFAFYMNVYCAACNGDTDVVYLNVEKICPSKEAADDMCESLVQAPNNTYVKKCVPNVIDTCPANFTDRKTTRKCTVDENSSLYRYHRVPGTFGKGPTEIVYRNRHCAICNRVPESPPLNCTSDTYRPPVDGMRPPVSIPPFSVILDLNTGFKTEQEYDDTIRVRAVQLQRCSTREIFDPFSNRCRLLFCPPGSRLASSTCVRQELRGNDTVDVDGETPSRPAGSTPDGGGDGGAGLDCALLRLNESEFDVIDGNGSILLRHSLSASGGVYRRDQYWINDDGATFICNPFADIRNVTYNVTGLVHMFEYDRLQSLLSVVGSTISLSALVVQFCVYVVLPALRNTPGKCLLCLIVALFVGQLLYLCVGLHGSSSDDASVDEVKPFDNLSDSVCFIQAIVMHYAFVASFCWMNVLAVDICRTFGTSQVSSSSGSSGSKSSSCSFYVYSLYAWGVPLIIVACAASIDLLPESIDLSYYRPLYGHRYCWIANPVALIIFFVTPLGALWLANVIMYVISAYHIRAASEAARLASSSSSTGSAGLLILYVKLSCVMGLTWGFGLLSAFTDWTAVWYLFIVCNTLQGALICGSFVCTRRTFRLLTEKYGRKTEKNAARRSTDATQCVSRAPNMTVTTGLVRTT